VPDTPDPPSNGEILLRPRPPQSWRDRLEQLADATGTTALRIAVGGGLVVLGLAVGVWLLRPAPTRPEVSLPFASTTVATSSTITTTELSTLVVHVAGAVRSPGVHQLEPGARVVDAIAAAGGLRSDADGARINLAAPVADGERVYVPVVGEQAPPVEVGVPGPAGGGATPSDGPVNLNTADEEVLETLPGVGPATAAAIVQHRQEVGGFASVDELLDVPGIGDAKLAQLRDLVTV
jgi:competence protein ComEA